MFPAENSNNNYWMTSSLTDEHNQAALYMSNPSYLSSLMQNLTLDNNNYQENIALSNQNNVQTYAPNSTMNLFPTRERCVQPVISTHAPTLYHQYSTATSISNNVQSEYNFQALSAQAHPHYYPTTQDRYCGSFVHSKPYDKTQLLIECIISNPYLVMINPLSYCDFLSILDACKKNKKVLNALIGNMAEFPAEVLIQVSCHKYGSHVIKKLINVAKKVPSISLLPRVFASRIVAMTNDQLGWPVIQTCLRSLDKLKNRPLYEELVKNCLEISTGKYGCIAMQKCFEIMDNYRDSAESYTPGKHLLKAISNNAALLSQDPYGNFVLQFVIKRSPQDCVESIAVALEPLYERLCTSENGSYLVEKILNTPCRFHVTQALLKSDLLAMLAQDEYGNYTIQTLLKETKVHKPDDYQKLCKRLSLDLGALENSLFGKNVSRLLKDGCKDEAKEGEMHKRLKEVIRQRKATFVEKNPQEERCSCGALKENL